MPLLYSEQCILEHLYLHILFVFVCYFLQTFSKSDVSYRLEKFRRKTHAVTASFRKSALLFHVGHS